MTESFPLVDPLVSLVEPFSELLGAHADPATVYDLDGTIIMLNDAATLLRRTVHFSDLQEGTLARDAFALAVKGENAAYEARVRSNEGVMNLRVDLAPVRTGGAVAGVFESVRELRMMVGPEPEDDQLTGLPSVTVLYDRISRLLLQLRRDSRPFAVHLFAVAAESSCDEALVLELRRVTARRLTATLRQVDTVARLGRAFVVVQPEVNDLLATTRLIERLTDELREPLAWNGRLHIPIVRVGSALATRNTASVDELFVEADLALARVRGTRILETPNMDEGAQA